MSRRSSLASRLFTRAIYVRFDEHALAMREVDSGAEFRDAPRVATRAERGGRVAVAVGAAAETAASRDQEVSLESPFAHPRLVVHRFEAAQALFRYGLVQIVPRPALVRAVFVLHPLRALAADLTDVEARVLEECALAAGARQAVVHVGAELSADEVTRRALEALASRR